jgi:aspartyl-tRNA(Asn)/glutamyl-tRNA(Gln) amidotransferase subunit A
MLSAIAENRTDLRTPDTIFGHSVKAIRVGVPRSLFYDGLNREVEAAVDEALNTLKGLTAGVREVQLPEVPRSPDIPELLLPYLRVIGAEAYAFHEEMLKRSPDRYNARTRKNIESGAGISAADYIHARREMERLRVESGRLFEGVDVLVTPSAPGPAFLLGEPAGLVFLRNSAPWNLYGLPAISIPCGFTAESLPVGLQITGPAGREDLVLSVAAEYQRVTEWHRRWPQSANI